MWKTEACQKTCPQKKTITYYCKKNLKFLRNDIRHERTTNRIKRNSLTTQKRIRNRRKYFRVVNRNIRAYKENNTLKGTEGIQFFLFKKKILKFSLKT